MGSLILVRHGPSAHVHRGVLDHAGVHQWRAAYDAAGIVATCVPPASLVAIAATAAHIVSSDLPRALESAARLAPARDITVSPLMREAPLAIPSWPIRLPLVVWNSLIAVRWYSMRLRGAELRGDDWARAAQAAQWLGELVADGATAVIVTHGVFRHLLRSQLLRTGWSLTQQQGGYRHWSAWRFAAPQRTRQADSG